MTTITFLLAVLALVYQVIWPAYSLKVSEAVDVCNHHRYKLIWYTIKLEDDPDNDQYKQKKGEYKTKKSNSENRYKKEVRNAQIKAFVVSTIVALVSFALLPHLNDNQEDIKPTSKTKYTVVLLSKK